ncbi:hydrophobic surface binding protein [Mycena floridula]|nr:hydrophobic surface binding protein [Mycena floridula]
MVSSKLIFIFCVATLACARPFKRTPAQVEADLDNMTTQVSNLDTAITGFPASGLAGALTIHTDIGNLNTAIQQATTDTMATPPFSEADGNLILTKEKKFLSILVDVMNQLVSKKTSFQGQKALPLGGVPALVLQDLQSLSPNVCALEKAIIAKLPADLVAEMNVIKNSVSSSFATAIAAYS